MTIMPHSETVGMGSAVQMSQSSPASSAHAWVHSCAQQDGSLWQTSEPEPKRPTDEELERSFGKRIVDDTTEFVRFSTDGEVIDIDDDDETGDDENGG